MKINRQRIPESSFYSVDKDMDIIIGWLLKNDRFKNLLYYTTKDAYDRPKLTEEQTVELIEKNIKRVPKVYVDGSVLNYIIISFDNFSPSTNPQFRDNTVIFDIICHFDQWELNDNQLRPQRIAAEIDTAFNNRHLTGIGKTEFVGMQQILLNDEFAGLSLIYNTYHGGDDKYDPLNPDDKQEMIDEFNKLYNSDEFR